MGAKQFDYYIFIDYSKNLLGYMIMERTRIAEFLLKKIIEKNKVLSFMLKIKIKKTTYTPEIYPDILGFLKGHDNCLILVSVDNKQYSNFERLVHIINGKNIKVIKESDLKKGTPEYRMSLVLDTLLNIERLKYDRK